MSLFLHHLLGVHALALRPLVVTAAEPLLWVSSSDLPDPTPFLGEDQMLLTTGRQFDADGPGSQYAGYVQLLLDHGVRALGFGTEVLRATPAELVSACETLGLALVEVPYRTPFIAIIRWASEFLVGEAHERDAWALRAHRAVALATLRSPGPHDPLRVLAQELGRAVVLFDADGAVADSGPRRRLSEAVLDELTGEAVRMLGAATRASSSLSHDSSISSLQTLGQSGSLTGVLAVAGGLALDAAESSVVTSVVALLEVALARDLRLRGAARALSSQLVTLLLAGEVTLVRTVLGPLDVILPTEPVRVVCVRKADADALEQFALRRYPAHFFALHEGAAGPELALLVLPAEGRRALDELAAEHGVAVGASAAVRWTDFGTGVAHARQSLAAARPASAVVAGDASEGMFGLLTDAAVARVAAARLDLVLLDPDGPALLADAEVWLRHNALWDPAARELGIHRHSLRARMRRLETLLDEQLTDFDAKVRLWALLVALPERQARGDGGTARDQPAISRRAPASNSSRSPV